MRPAPSDPQFPPLLTSRPVDAGQRPFDIACRAAAAGIASAGDMYWSSRCDEAHCAVVFEPDLTAERAIEGVGVAMVAIGDAIGALAPPNVSIGYRWPATLLVNDAIAGGVDAAVSNDVDTDGAPVWMVIALNVALYAGDDAPEPGHDMERTNLWDEGCGNLDRTQVLEAYGRHLLSWVHTWQGDGFKPAHRMWLARGPKPGAPTTATLAGEVVAGAFSGLDQHGGLLIECDGTLRLIRLLDAFGRASEQ